MPAQKVGENVLFVGSTLTVKELFFKKRDGLQFKKEIAVFRPAVVVVAIDERQRVLLTHEFRPVAGKWVWHLPAGKLDHPVTPLQQAKIELAEEGHVKAARWKKLHEFKPTGNDFKRVFFYLATRLSPVDTPCGLDEEIDCKWVTLPNAKRMALKGQFNHPAVAFAILRAAFELKK